MKWFKIRKRENSKSASNDELLKHVLELKDKLNKIEKGQNRNYNKIHKLHNDIGYFIITGKIINPDKEDK